MRTGLKETLAGVIVICVVANRGLIAQAPFDQPHPSTLPFGAVDCNNLLATQTVRDEVQWYWANLAGGGALPIGKALPVTAEGFRSGPKGGIIGSPANSMLLHRWRLAYGYFWGMRAIAVFDDFFKTDLLRMAFPAEKLAGKKYMSVTGPSCDTSAAAPRLQQTVGLVGSRTVSSARCRITTADCRWFAGVLFRWI